jgi:hypothetical protein
MVTNYPYPLASQREARATVATVESVVAHREGLGGRLLDWFHQTVCGFHGHDALLQFGEERMFLRCVSCGHESPGWTLDETPPTVTFRGDARRHRIVRPQLVGARRIA